MARIHAKDADFSFNGVSIEDELNTVTLSCDVPQADITAFTDVYQNTLLGKPGFAYEIAGSLDTVAAQGHKTLFGALEGGAKTTIYSPDNATTTFTNTAAGVAGSILTRYRIDLPVGDASKYSASMQCSGQVVRA